jgi:putative FmdB family regulatory protein
MPMYEFLCLSCGHKDDMLMKVSDPVKIDCPKCKKDSFTKQVSAPNFQLSGTGWYETDFKNKKPMKTEDKKETKKEVTKENV